MYKDDVGPIEFFPGNIYNLVFSDKRKNSNSENFIHIGFCGPGVSTKFWNFAADIDFDT